MGFQTFPKLCVYHLNIVKWPVFLRKTGHFFEKLPIYFETLAALSRNILSAPSHGLRTYVIAAILV